MPDSFDSNSLDIVHLTSRPATDSPDLVEPMGADSDGDPNGWLTVYCDRGRASRAVMGCPAKLPAGEGFDFRLAYDWGPVDWSLLRGRTVEEGQSIHQQQLARGPRRW